MILTLITPPQPAISLEEAKWNLRVTHDDEDLHIDRLIMAAHMRVQEETGRLYGAQVWEAAGVLGRDFLPDARPVTGIVSVRDGVGSPVDGVALSDGWFTAAVWPATPLQIRFTAGHAAMPETLRHAMHLLIGHWYRVRETATERLEEIPYGASSLMGLHRRMYC